MPVVQSLIELSKEIHELMPFAQLSITNTEMYVHAIPGADFYLEAFDAGHTFPEGSIAKETVTTGKVVTRMGNKQLTGGIPYQGTGIPLFENGELVGAMCVFYATSNREAVQNAAEDMTATVQELHVTLETFRSSMQALFQVAEVMEQDSVQMSDSSAHIRDMTDFIAEVSAQTKLLGLNAAIEAAHAKEYGAGFSVIAAEVRRLSERVTQSVTEVKGMTDTLVGTVNQVQNQIKDVFGRIQEGYAATETFSQVSLQLLDLGERLQELSQVIKI